MTSKQTSIFHKLMYVALALILGVGAIIVVLILIVGTIISISGFIFGNASVVTQLMLPLTLALSYGCIGWYMQHHLSSKVSEAWIITCLVGFVLPITVWMYLLAAIADAAYPEIFSRWFWISAPAFGIGMGSILQKSNVVRKKDS